MVRRVTPAELQAALDPSNVSREPAPLVLDVRERWELDICAIDGAIHIPLGELAERRAELDRERPLVVLCHHGVRSLHAAEFLQGCGFADVADLLGGIDAWAGQIDPAMDRY